MHIFQDGVARPTSQKPTSFRSFQNLQSPISNPMSLLTSFLSSDHDRLEELLQRALDSGDPVTSPDFAAFRAALLRHIGIEETIVFPAIARYQGGTPSPDAARLRADHGAIASLLVAEPTPAIFRMLRHILDGHNALEESPDGVYARIDALAGEEASALLSRIHAHPEVPVLPCKPLDAVRAPLRRAVERAGYAWEEFNEQ